MAFSRGKSASITVNVRDHLGEQTEKEIDLPDGVVELVCLGRTCGDFYASVRSERFYVSAVGDEPFNAISAAISKALGTVAVGEG